MLDATHIFRPANTRRILWASYNKFLCRHRCRHVIKPSFNFGLTIRRIGSHVTEVAAKLCGHLHASVCLDIDASIQRQSQPGSPTGYKLVKGTAASEREVKIEFPNLSGTQVGCVSSFERCECHRRIQIVKDLHRPHNIQNVIDNASAIRAEAGANDGVGIPGTLQRLCANAVPIRVQA